MQAIFTSHDHKHIDQSLNEKERTKNTNSSIAPYMVGLLHLLQDNLLLLHHHHRHHDFIQWDDLLFSYGILSCSIKSRPLLKCGSSSRSAISSTSSRSSSSSSSNCSGGSSINNFWKSFTKELILLVQSILEFTVANPVVTHTYIKWGVCSALQQELYKKKSMYKKFLYETYKKPEKALFQPQKGILNK